MLVHAALRKIGRILGGPDVVIGALLDTVGSSGTILGYGRASDRYLVLPHGIAAPRWIKGAALRSLSGH